MIRLGQNIRLTSKEVDLFKDITGFEPTDVKTIDNFDAYIEQCKRYYWGVSKDTRFLHWLIDEERSRCMNNR